MIEHDRANELAAYDECRERRRPELSGKNDRSDRVDRAPSTPPSQAHHGALARLGGDGHGARAPNVTAISRMTPSEELAITAGSAFLKTSFRRALLPVCTGD
jgi:hypothetical protein